MASVFLQDDEFNGQAINLNGIVYHPGGFLLTIKKSSGTLYRIPLNAPQQFSKVSIPRSFEGGDGLLLLGDQTLVLVANKTPGVASNSAFVLKSADGWGSAEVVDSRELGMVYPTTCTALNDKVCLLSSHLDEWIGAIDENREAIAKKSRQAEIQEISIVSR